MRLREIFYLSTALLVAVTVGTSYADRLYPQLLEGKMELSDRPMIDHENILTLHLHLKEHVDRVSVKVVFRLPRGVKVLGERTEFNDTISYGDERSYSVRIKFTSPVPSLHVSVYAMLADGRKVSQQFTLSIPSSTFGVSLAPSQYLAKLRLRVLSFAPGGTTTISGKILYFDDNAQVEKPVRSVKVRLISTPEETVLGEAFTDRDGEYLFSISSNLPLSICIEVRFENDVLSLTDSDQNVYRFRSISHSISQTGSYRIDYIFDSANPYRMLGFIHDTVMDAHDFLMEKLGWSRRRIRVEYPSGNWPYYHYWYHSDGKIYDESITIPTGWEWRRTTIIHEYGHSVMSALYDYNAYNLPDKIYEGSHQLTTVSDRGFAMTEGWAEFFEALVDDNAFNVTYWINKSTPNIEENEWWSGDPNGNGNNEDGSIVEGAVASVLWDIADTPQSQDHQPEVDDDPINGELSELWRVMDVAMPKDIIEFKEDWSAMEFDMEDELGTIYSRYHILPSSAISVQPSKLRFGEVLIGKPKKLILTISNTGENMVSIDLVGPPEITFSVTSLFIPPGSSAEVEVNFLSDELGKHSGKLTVKAGDPASSSIEIPFYAYVVQPGDVTGNGRITAFDASLVLQSCAGLRDLSEDERKIADVDGDDRVTPHDVISILKFVVGLDKSAHSGEKIGEEKRGTASSRNMSMRRKGHD
ncbi:hypothetical protein J7M22_19025 [Candidatus Poribacteria bacterium]|nr:hypothetical protein [Candidatus Poribacteria bacterium]